jgi:mannose-6-phosphate isomerase-like protein (cupin superfamily)|tara:strand:- start:4624 stop:4968 length:345 start_codon:yes stop_codon:yes gene_type:complete
MNYFEKRPWGTFENLLDTDYCKVKQIIIKPNQAPSYQYHFKRQEVWVVVQGSGELRLDDSVTSVNEGQIIHIPFESKHQIKNNTDRDLIFIEIQMGDYFGEDDIVRLEDSYGRI